MRRVLVALVALAAIGCSVPTDESAQLIDPERLPDVLRSTTTTTTTTSLAPQDTRTVTYYLIQQLDRKVLIPVEREVDSDLLVDILAPFFDGTLPAEEGFINALLEYELATISRPEESNIATVGLTTIDVDLPPGLDTFRDAVGQLVWTLTQFSAIDAVVILRDGEEVTLPTNSTEEIGDAEPGTPVDVSFYDRYDPDAPTPTTTSTTTTTTTTTTVAPTTTEGAG